MLKGTEERQEVEQQHPFVEESKRKIDPAVLNTVNIANMANFSRKTYELMKAMQSEGIDVPLVFTLPRGKAYQLDFEDNEILPDELEGQILNLPGKALFSFTIHNYGPSTLFFSTNSPVGRYDAKTELPPEADTKMTGNMPTFRRINLVAPDNEAKIQIVGLI